jgi:hypothetical protein
LTSALDADDCSAYCLRHFTLKERALGTHLYKKSNHFLWSYIKNTKYSVQEALLNSTFLGNETYDSETTDPPTSRITTTCN